MSLTLSSLPFLRFASLITSLRSSLRFANRIALRSISPKLSQSTLSNLETFQKSNPSSWDMLHLAYIMYVPGLSVGRTSMDGVVGLTTGEQAALGTTAYIVSKKGVDEMMEYHGKVRGKGGEERRTEG